MVIFSVRIFFILVAFSLAAVNVCASNINITINNTNIDFTSENATLSAIATEISRSMGIKVYLDKSQENRKVSVDLKGVPFEKGIKMIAYPLNYVIFRDAGNNVKELLIFKTQGLNQGQYRIFAGEKTQVEGEGDRLPAAAKGTKKKEVSKANTGFLNNGKIKKDDEANERKSDGSDTIVLTGDRGFEIGIWVTKRMQEAETLRAQKQVEADSREYAKREMQPVKDVVNLAAIQQNKNIAASGASTSVSSGGGNTDNISTGSAETKTSAAYQAPSSYNNWSANMQSRYYQSTSQARSYSYYNYYQQRSSAVNNSYINYMRSYGK